MRPLPLALLCLAPSLALALPQLEGSDVELVAPRGDSWWMSVLRVPVQVEGSATALRYTPDGQRLVVSTDSGELALFDIDKGRTLWTQKTNEHRFEIFVEDVHPANGTFVATPWLMRSEGMKDAEIRRLSDGGLVRKLSAESNYFHKDYREVEDHRRSNEGNREYAQLGHIAWDMIAGHARWTPDGKALLVQWRNFREGHDLHDQDWRLYDATSFQQQWYWLAAGTKDHVSVTSNKFDGALPLSNLHITRPNGRMIYSTPDAEIRHLAIEQIRKDMKLPNLHDHGEGRLVVRMEQDGNWGPGDLSFTADGERVLVTNYLDGEHVQFVDIPSKKILFRTERILMLRNARFAPGDGHVVGWGGRVHVWNDDGKIVGHWPRYGSGVNATRAVAIHPTRREVAVMIDSWLYLLAERRAQEVEVGTGPTPVNRFIRYGVDLHVAAEEPAKLFWKSGKDRLDDEYENEIWAYTSTTGSGDVPIEPEEPADRWGAVSIAADKPVKVRVVGGLSKDEFKSTAALRKSLPPW